MDFCGAFVDYDLSVKAPSQGNGFTGTATEAVVAQQDGEAAKLYFYHLSGMGIEPWDHTKPEAESTHPLRPCARSVAQMVCHTVFPRALPSVKLYQETSYTRPCRTSCENYIQACNVECCDEGVQCVWTESDSPKVTLREDGTEA